MPKAWLAQNESQVFGFKMKKLLTAFWNVLLAGIALGSSFTAFAGNHVVIIAGKGGTTEYAARFGRHAKQLQDLLQQQYGFRPEQITVLAESGAPLASTHVNVETTFMKLATTMRSEDVLLVVLLGHGTADANFSKFNLVGADLRDLDFARLLERVPARQQVLINTAAASAGFAEKLAREDRVIITATRSAEEKYATIFPEYFIEALTKGEEVDLNKDQKISLLEAFDYARDRVVRFYEQANRLRPEHPLLEDNGDGLGSEIPVAQAFIAEINATPTDGRLAARTFFNAGTVASSGSELAPEVGGPLGQRKAKLLAEIATLKSRKSTLSPAEYERKLEELFIALARLNREIKQSKP